MTAPKAPKAPPTPGRMLDPDTSDDRNALAAIICRCFASGLEPDWEAEEFADAILAAGFRRDYLGPTDPADLTPEPGNGAGYAEVRNSNGSHK